MGAIADAMSAYAQPLLDQTDGSLEQMQMALADALQLSNNPVDLEIIGLEGRGDMLREYFKRLKIPKIVPDRNAIINKSANQQFQQLVENLAAAMGADPQRLIEIAQNPPAQQGQKAA